MKLFTVKPGLLFFFLFFTFSSCLDIEKISDEKQNFINAILPKVTTDSVTNITPTTASISGNLLLIGIDSVTARGHCWSTSPDPTISDYKTDLGGTITRGIYISTIMGLNPDSIYYVRAYAINSAGTGYGNTKSFKTQKKQVPVLTTSDIIGITQTTATCGGNISSDGGSTITARGICWSTVPAPTIVDSTSSNGSGANSFTCQMTGLNPNTTYYTRAYATNIVGTGYGGTQSFTTKQDTIGNVTDTDGNIYHTVAIGSQVWMVENLKVTKYRNGNPIPNVIDSSSWINRSTGAYCDYNHNVGYSLIYGKLYNWYTISDPRKLCPTGWKVPNNADWTTLIINLGGEFIAGGKLKEAGTKHWSSPNTGATNESGFNALPGGFRDTYNEFKYLTYYNYMWSSTQFDPKNSYYMRMRSDSSSVFNFYVNNNFGFSVRCVRDH